MFIALAILLIIVSIMLHELGHALAMHKKGIKFDRIGLGIPIKALPHFKFKLKRLPDVVFELHLLIVGAFVSITPEGQKKFKEIPHKDQALILGGGIVANLLFAGIMLLLVFFTSERPFLDVITGTPFLICAGVMLFLIFGHNFFCKYLLLPVGLLMLGAVIWCVAQDPFKAVVGPVGLAGMVGKFSIDFKGAVVIAGLISLALGLTNALPFYPLDGGQLLSLLLGRWTKNPKVSETYNKISGLAFLLIVAFAFYSDFVNLFK